jgi:hypothetical protein
MDELKSYLLNLIGDMVRAYEEDYRSALERILIAVKEVFTHNLNSYSEFIKAMLMDKEIMEEVKRIIDSNISELKSCQNNLNKIVWSEDKHE